ncbi:MAG: glycoside hydrolase family 20 zincin-like fold domain-containing protein, partial [Spirochaetia bacterium]
MEEIILVPAPRTIRRRKGTVPVPATLESELAGYTVGADSPQGVNAQVDTGLIKGEQSYRLSIGPDDLTLIAGDQQGLYYGFMTLRQLVRQADDAGRIPCVHIEDWPEFPVRGVMLDISRDRVPTMETFKRLIDLWAEL